MGNMQISRAGVGFIQRRKRVNNKKQGNYQEFWKVMKKQKAFLCKKALQQAAQVQWPKWQVNVKPQ